MSGTIQQDFGQINAAAEDIKTGAKALDDRLNQLEEFLNKERENWTGGASEAYFSARSEWESAIKEMNLLLNQIGSAVQESNEGFQQGERHNTGLWS
ncbi:MAG: WXG100 family type VII secretion target [Micrococcales bacterium]|nr:WXG100 family type VII secretion target [Micrococcales bacterium]